MKKIIVGISAADGVQIGVRLLTLLREIPDVETHLVMSRNADTNLRLELGMDRAAAEALADVCYPPEDLAATISSGSFYTDGMIVAPCSMKTLSAIANGYSDSLLIRAADVCIKECRKVVLMPREMPLSRIHLRNMSLAAEAGCVIIPPMLTFYNGSKSVDDMVNHALGKALMQFGIVLPGFRSWRGGRLSKEDK